MDFSASPLTDAFPKLVADIGIAIDARCRRETVTVPDIISAVTTILSGAIKQIEDPSERRLYLEEALRQIKITVEAQSGRA